jgi:D-aminopeptidase
MAQDGMARALRPVHTPLDGDIVFVGATGDRPLTDKIFSVSELGSLAADVVARAIGRGVFEAKAPSFPGALPSWHDRFTAR